MELAIILVFSDITYKSELTPHHFLKIRLR
jgi:hypothetical protein